MAEEIEEIEEQKLETKIGDLLYQIIDKEKEGDQDMLPNDSKTNIPA